MGIVLSLSATLCLAFAGIVYGYCFRLRPDLNPITLALVRIGVGFIPPIYFIFKNKSLRQILGMNRSYLLLWGLFGAATVTSYFFSTKMIGVGMTQILSSSQGIVFALGAPFILKEVFSWKSLIGIGVSILGLNCVVSSKVLASAALPAIDLLNSHSIVPGLLSGLLAGFAYLFLAKCRKTENPGTISLYWALSSLILQLILISWFPTNSGVQNQSTLLSIIHENSNNWFWILILSGGLLTLASQLLLAEAFNHGDVVFLTLITYLGPLLNLAVDVSYHRIEMSQQLVLGASLIILGSGVIPLIKRNKAI